MSVDVLFYLEPGAGRGIVLLLGMVRVWMDELPLLELGGLPGGLLGRHLERSGRTDVSIELAARASDTYRGVPEPSGRQGRLKLYLEPIHHQQKCP